jgi:hypothetical protein
MAASGFGGLFSTEKGPTASEGAGLPVFLTYNDNGGCTASSTVAWLASASTASGARSGGSLASKNSRKASTQGPRPSPLLQSRRTTADLVAHKVSRVPGFYVCG